MSMTDPIADFLTRIRNAIQAAHDTVEVPASGLKKEMARILEMPSVRERLAALGAEPAATGPAEFEAMVRNYLATTRKLGDEIGIKPQ